MTVETTATVNDRAKSQRCAKGSPQFVVARNSLPRRGSGVAGGSLSSTDQVVLLESAVDCGALDAGVSGEANTVRSILRRRRDLVNFIAGHSAPKFAPFGADAREYTREFGVAE